MNRNAVGFDIYSEPVRRAAIDHAIATGQASMTAKVTLVQESTVDVQTGVLVVLPVFAGATLPDTAPARMSATTGLIVSVFRLGDLMNSFLSAHDTDRAALMDIRLYDAPDPDPDALLFATAVSQDGAQMRAKYSHVQTVVLFGRHWTLRTLSKPAFETVLGTSGPAIIAVAGTLLALLLTALTWGLAIRARDSAQVAAATEESNAHIQLLMQEVNHRSRNLLAVVRAIARQTAFRDVKNFPRQFSQRIDGLAASHDILVHNQWRGVPIADLATWQLAHFGGLIGNRVTLNGPPVQLSAPASQAIGMAFHELSTNAGKYGALSGDVGTVSINWTAVPDETGDDRLRISWIEDGGPVVVAPGAQGFGSVVLGAMAQHNLGARVETRFDPGGVQWHVDCLLRNVQGGGGV